MIIRKQNQSFRPQSSQAGFTIIESLIAIIVVSILLVGLSPIIVLSIANRVQARRVELGTQAARTYIDGVKSGVIGDVVNSGATYQLPTITNIPPSQVPAPNAAGNLTCDLTTHLCNSNPSLYCVPGTPPSSNPSPGNSSLCSINSVTDMVVQAYTYQLNPAVPPDLTQGYVLGVRVYRADAFKESGKLKTAAVDSARSQAFTGGLGDRTAPIVEISTDIAGKNTKYNTYCDRLNPQKNALNNNASNCQ